MFVSQYQAAVSEQRHYRVQQEQARVANYRIAWKQGEGYIGQEKIGDKWESVAPFRTSHAEACLDTSLHANMVGFTRRLYPTIANLTEGRSEYTTDFTLPFPGVPKVNACESQNPG